MNRRSIGFFIFLLTLLSGAGMAVLCLHLMGEQKNILIISHDSGIYDESIDVNVNAFAPGVIYYTVSGSSVGVEGYGQYGEPVVYEGPIELELQNDTSVHSFEFYCIFDDGTRSETYKRDYILDAGGKDRFSTTYVVSVMGEEEKLFGYEEGIFVRGRQFDEYMAENPDVNLLNTVIPANYYNDMEVPVKAVVFQQDGTEILNQNCGLKIYGNWTRAKNQKSFRLIARHIYDDFNEFSYSFLPNLISDEKGIPIDAFQRISFHNSGDDNGYAFIRTTLVGELARRSGFSDVLISESATVYVNGKYQGVYWLQNTFDDRYFKEKYGRYHGEMVVCEGTLRSMSDEEAETENEAQCVEEYNDLCTWIETADMEEEDNWRRVCGTIDIDNFARYMALEYYIGNLDWPHNNVKVYRYMGASEEDYYEGTVFDGKYRYLLFDTDYGMGLKFQGWYGMDETEERLEALCQSEYQAVLFQKLLHREEFKRLFISAVTQLMYESFSMAEVSAVLEEYNAKRYNELRYMMEETVLLKNSIWESDDNSLENVEQEMAEILRFAENRPYTVLAELQKQWDCGREVELSILSDDSKNYFINGLKVEGPVYAGVCYENIPMEVRCDNRPGVIVMGYYVNSDFVEGESLEILPAEWMDADGHIFIEPVFKTEMVENLVISGYHIRGTEDYVILRNNGQVPLLLSDYALTDSEEKWSKGRLPGVELKPGEEYVVYGEKYSGIRGRNSTQLSFSWSMEEEILLIHISEGVVDRKN